MKRGLAPSMTLLGLLLFVLPISSRAQQAEALDPAAARDGLSVKPPRNPVKGKIVRRTYERIPAKGLGVETGPSELIDVEVVHFEGGGKVERPYVPLPILFVVNSDQLLDETSRNNIDVMAGVLRDLCETEAANFSVQGHTSAEGASEANQSLSERRAARIHALLTAKGVEAKSLTAVGLGEDAARVPENAPESERQQDRRVLIVRMK